MNSCLLEKFKAFNSVTNLAFERINSICKMVTCSNYRNDLKMSANRQTMAVKLVSFDFVNKEKLMNTRLLENFKAFNSAANFPTFTMVAEQLP